MRRLRTVLLRHDRPQDRHYDWMFEDPHPDRVAAAQAPMVTYRAALPWSQWRPGLRIALQPLPAHRRAYLSRQGRVSGERGSVVRVGRGTLDVHDHHRSGGIYTLRLSEPATHSATALHLQVFRSPAIRDVATLIVLPHPAPIA